MATTFNKPRHWLVLVAPVVVIAAAALVIHEPIPSVSVKGEEAVNIDISPDGKYLACIFKPRRPRKKASMRVFRTVDGKNVFEADDDKIGWRTCWNSDGSVLSVLSYKDVLLRAGDWKELNVIRGHRRGYTTGVSFGDGKNLFLATHQNVYASFERQKKPHPLIVNWNATSPTEHRSERLDVYECFDLFDVATATMENEVRVAVSPERRFCPPSRYGKQTANPFVKVFSFKRGPNLETKLTTEYQIPLLNWDEQCVKIHLTPNGKHLGIYDQKQFQLIHLKDDKTTEVVHSVLPSQNYPNYRSERFMQLMDVSNDSQFFSYSLQDRVEVFYIPTKKVVFSRKFRPGFNRATSLDPAGKYIAIYHSGAGQIRFHSIPQP